MLSVVLKFAATVVAALGLLVGAVVPAGAASVSVAVPGAPTGVVASFSAVTGTVEPRTSSVLVSFTPSSDPSVSLYVVTGTAAGGVTVSATGVSSPIVVSGLTAGKSYSFVVTALSASAGSFASAASNVVVAPGVPAVASVSAVSSVGLVSWVAVPAVTNGSAISAYEVGLFSKDGVLLKTFSAAPSVLSFQLPDLVNGTRYLVGVRAVNAVGSAAWSVLKEFTYVAPRPGVVEKVTLSENTMSRAMFTWDVPLSQASVPATGWIVVYTLEGLPTSNGTLLPLSQRSFTFTYPKVQDGKKWLFGVAAVNAAGTGSPVYVSVVTPRTRPLPPVNVAVTGNGPDQVTLSWAAADVLLAAPVSDYVVEYSRNGGGTWVTVNDGVSAVPGFTFRYPSVQDHASWRWRVSAVNLYGKSSPVVKTYVTPFLVPDRVLFLKADSSVSQVVLSWLPAVPGRAVAASDYVIQYSADAGQTWVTVDDGVSTSTSFTFTYSSVQGSQAWKWRVMAVNQYGLSAPAMVSYRTPRV